MKKIYKFMAVVVSVILLCFATACDIQGILNSIKDGDIEGALDGILDGIGGANPVQNDPKGDSELRVHFLDVGQGDSILVELPDDTIMLIDSGEGRNTGATEISTFIVNYIKSLNITTIDYLVLTHSDADHAGNMVEILKAFEVEKAYIPNVENTSITKTYKYFYDALQVEKYGNNLSCEIEVSDIYDVIESESQTDNFFIAFLAPTDEEYEDLNNSSSPSAHEKNGVSPIMFLEYMDKRIIFTGDTVVEVEQKVVNNYNAGIYDTLLGKSGTSYGVNLEDIDILKIAHHGSTTSSCVEFLSLTSPSYSIISLGQENEYGHPHTEILERLSAISSTIYRTDIDRTIVATVYPDVEKEISFDFAEGYLESVD